MSKSSKASPRKKKPLKKRLRGGAPLSKKDAVAPPKLEREDQLLLQLALSEKGAKELQLRMAQKEMDEATTNWNRQLTAVNEKYKLNPKKDTINLNTGIIQKGS